MQAVQHLLPFVAEVYKGVLVFQTSLPVISALPQCHIVQELQTRCLLSALDGNPSVGLCVSSTLPVVPLLVISTLFTF